MPSCGWLQGKRVLRCVLACCAAVTCSSLAHAQAHVHVRAGSTLELRAERVSEGNAVQGTLLDDVGTPLSGRSVSLAVQDDVAQAPRWRTVRTRPDGSFELLVRDELTRGRALARFAGDPDHAASETEAAFDFARVALDLQLVEPRDGRLDLDAASVPLVLAANSAWGGGGVEIELDDARGQPLAGGSTDLAGRVRLALTSNRLEPGRIALLARSPGDELRAPTQVELRLLVFRRSQLVLHARLDHELDRLRIEGALRDLRGPLPHRAIGVFDGEHHLTTVFTDDQGQFRHTLRSPSNDTGRSIVMQIQARFDSAEVALGSTRSEVARVVIQPPTGGRTLWLLVPAAIGALAALGFRRGERTRAAESTPARVLHAGVHVPPPSPRSIAQVFEVGGVVLDLDHEWPLPDATVWLESNHGERVSLPTAHSGRFQSGALSAGRWTLQVDAPGYTSVQHTLAIPHRGPSSQLEVRLQSLRGAAVQAYKPVALRWLPLRDLWGRWTPREVLEHAARSRGDHQALAQLTEQVERAAYAPTPPTHDEILSIAAASETLLRSGGQSDAAGEVPPTPVPTRPPRIPGRR